MSRHKDVGMEAKEGNRPKAQVCDPKNSVRAGGRVKARFSRRRLATGLWKPGLKARRG